MELLNEVSTCGFRIISTKPHVYQKAFKENSGEPTWFKALDDVAGALGSDRIGRRMLIHGGDDHLVRRGVEVVGLGA